MTSLAHRFPTMTGSNPLASRWPPTAYALHVPGLAEPRIGKAMVGALPER